MAFDPDAYLAATAPSSGGFDPDAYLKSKPPKAKSEPVNYYPADPSIFDTMPNKGKNLADLLAGATGILRGGANLVSSGSGDKIWPPTEGDSGYKTAGSLADPAAWAVGGGVMSAAPKLLSKAATNPGVAKVIEEMSKHWLGRATGRAATGAAAGGAIGGLSDEGDAGTGATVGAVANTIIPPAFSGVLRGANALKQKVYPTPGALGVKAAGDKADDVIAALMSEKSNVPGVKLTAGQASVPANSAEFAALQNAVSKQTPSRYYGPTGIKGQQEAARLEAVRTIGKTPADLDAAVTGRANIANRNYQDAFSQAIKADPALLKLFQNPYVKDALPDAFKLAEAKGITPKENLTEFLHFVKISLDKQVGRSGDTALSNTEKGVVESAKKQLVEWLGNKNPLYDAARIRHTELSKPINQMKLGQEVEQALVAPATSAERASSFGSKVRQAENKVSKSTGKPRIEDLTPEQRKVFDAIEEDFKRNASYKELAGMGAKNLEDRIGAPVAPPTGWFQPIVSAARSWLNKILGAGHEAALTKLAPIMENPQEMAKLMQAATPKQRAVIESIMSKYVTQGAIVGGAQQGEPQ